jgi:alpha-D-ribose 1-methylphosphonate 5-triphosphate synthase subunit PhnH
MYADQLQQVRPGFHDAALGSQAVFRVALQALSHPGRVLDMPAVAELPRHGQSAAALLLLALLDSDCALWLSPSLANSDAATWLRFHTGCQCVTASEQASFLWIAAGDAMPALHTLNLGTDEYPDQSATCVIETGGLANTGSSAWQLQGPGIADVQPLNAAGLPDAFEAQWVQNQAAFPRGTDVFLTTVTQVAGLPRTTRISTSVEA